MPSLHPQVREPVKSTLEPSQQGDARLENSVSRESQMFSWASEVQEPMVVQKLESAAM